MLYPTAQDLATMLDLLSRIEAGGQGTSRRDLGELRLNIARRLRDRGQPLRDDEGDLLDLTVAEALADTGRPAEARTAFAQLANRLPENGRAQAGYAALLLESDDPAFLTQALDRWRLVLGKSSPRSDRWFRAKYSIALAHYKLGNKQRAAQVIQLTRALHPELGGPEKREQFTRLLDRCTLAEE
jgi:hypothetical protein